MTEAAEALTEGTQRRPTTPRYPNIVEGHYGVLCSDSDNPDDHQYWSAAGAEADRRFGYFGRMWTWFSSPSAVWEGFGRRPLHRTLRPLHGQPGALGGDPLRSGVGL